jgi:hypothetical protein
MASHRFPPTRRVEAKTQVTAAARASEAAMGRRLIAQREDKPRLIQSRRTPGSGSPISEAGDSLALKFLKQTVWKIVAGSIVASLIVHLVVGALSAVVIGQRVIVMVTDVPAEPEPDVTLVFPEPPPEPSKPKEPERYIRTAQGNTQDKAPQKADFISDKNTVASAMDAPEPGGDPALPSMKGTEGPGLELTKGNYQDGDLKDNAVPTPPPVAAAPPPAPPPPPRPDPAPAPHKQEIVKNEESAIDRMMREAELLAPPIAQVSKPSEVPPAPSQSAPSVSEAVAPTAEALPSVQSRLHAATGNAHQEGRSRRAWG